MTDHDLCFTPATRLVSLIRCRQVSPLEVTRAVLDRVERVNPALNSSAATSCGPPSLGIGPHEVARAVGPHGLELENDATVRLGLQGVNLRPPTARSRAQLLRRGPPHPRNAGGRSRRSAGNSWTRHEQVPELASVSESQRPGIGATSTQRRPTGPFYAVYAPDAVAVTPAA
jgi:hypothetical protein